jgi:hypothetical protein
MRVEAFLCRHYRTAVIGVVAIALLARVLAAVLAANIDPASAQVWEYGQIAATSITHGSLTRDILRPDGAIWNFPTAFMPPAGIVLWLGIYKLLGVSRLALGTMVAIEITCGAAIVYLCMRVARLLFGLASIGVLAGLLAALHPVFVYSVATYHEINIYILELLLLYYSCSSAVADSPRQALLIGLLFGVTVLTRTEYLMLGGALLLGALLRHRRPRLTVISLVAAAALIAPWTVRNYLVFGRFIPVADTVGLNLAKGFNPRANGSGGWEDKHFVIDELYGPVTDTIALTPHYEIDVDDVYRAAAEQFMAQYPQRAFVELPVRKLLLFWLFDIYDQITHSIVYQLSLWTVLLTSCLGMVVAYRAALFRTPDHRSILLLFAAQSIVMVSYAVHARYRMNVEPFLFAYSAAGLAWLGSRGHLSPGLHPEQQAS